MININLHRNIRNRQTKRFARPLDQYRCVRLKTLGQARFLPSEWMLKPIKIHVMHDACAHGVAFYNRIRRAFDRARYAAGAQRRAHDGRFARAELTFKGDDQTAREDVQRTRQICAAGIGIVGSGQ
jgi:hypothetical protein